MHKNFKAKIPVLIQVSSPPYHPGGKKPVRCCAVPVQHRGPHLPVPLSGVTLVVPVPLSGVVRPHWSTGRPLPETGTGVGGRIVSNDHSRSSCLSEKTTLRQEHRLPEWDSSMRTHAFVCEKKHASFRK